MKKRMTALFLTAAMAAAVAGCSQKTTEVKDTSAAAVSSEAKQEEGTKASAVGKESQAAGPEFLQLLQVLHGEAGGIPGG